MNVPFFSIIVPVYNVEGFVEKCIDGVLAQTFSDYELILVDDGSTDRSGIICERYAEFEHIKIIHKPNGGLSSARNTGLQVANGRYVLFIDSDDYWNDKNALKQIEEQISNYDNDVVLFGCIKKNIIRNKEVETRGSYDIDFLNSNKWYPDKITNLYYTGQFPGSAWIMCVKRRIISEFELSFPVNSTSEDLIWINNVLLHSNSVGAINNPFYIYIVGRVGQITSKSTVRGCNGMILAIQDVLSNSAFKEFKGINLQMGKVYLILLMHFSSLKKDDRTGLKISLKELMPILNASGLKNKILIRLIKFLGPYFSGKLIKFLYSIKSR